MANPENIIDSLREVIGRRIKNNKSIEYAKIETIVHDQGGGMSYCSLCKTDIDLEKLKEYALPKSSM